MNFDWELIKPILDYASAIFFSEPLMIFWGAWLGYFFSSKAQNQSDKLLLKLQDELNMSQSKNEEISAKMKVIEKRCEKLNILLDSLEIKADKMKGGIKND